MHGVAPGLHEQRRPILRKVVFDLYRHNRFVGYGALELKEGHHFLSAHCDDAGTRAALGSSRAQGDFPDYARVFVHWQIKWHFVLLIK
jgi:hypothetical protein